MLTATATPVAAAPGDLDPTFGEDGKETTDFGFEADWAYAVAIQPDGKIVAAGVAGYTATDDFALARYKRDGSLDLTFDGDGRVTTDFGLGGGGEIHGLAIQSDGKIVAAGFSNADFALARYNRDGSLDTTFDGDGKVTTDFFSDSDGAFGVAIQEDGNIVAAGYSVLPLPSSRYQWDFALARYKTDGSLDTTFDGDGKVTTDFSGDPDFDTDFARGVAIQPDGKIVAAGFASFRIGPSRGGIDFALARYHLDGSLDTAFDGDGKVTTDFSTDFHDNTGDFANAVSAQEGGKTVAAGYTIVSREIGGVVPADFDFALARYNPDGSLDVDLAHDGTVTTDFGSGHGLAIQRDGKIVVAGGEGGGFGLTRYTRDGFLDPTFGGGDGTVSTAFAGGGWSVAVAIQGDGKIVAAGAAGGDFGVARYTVCRRTSSGRSSIPCP